MAEETQEQKIARLERENQALRDQIAKLNPPKGGGPGATNPFSTRKPERQ